MFLMKFLPQEEQELDSQENQRLQQDILARYASMVTSGNRGAVLKTPEA